MYECYATQILEEKQRKKKEKKKKRMVTKNRVIKHKDHESKR